MRREYSAVVSRLISSMERGLVPWCRPWLTPLNAISGKPYRGINYLVLATSEFADPRYLTYLQAQNLGGHVKQGAKGFPIIKWIFPTEEDRKRDPNVRAFVKCFTVFSIQQCSGLDLPELVSVEQDPNAAAQEMINNWAEKPSIEYGGFQPAYNPILDRVMMPQMEKFRTSAHFWGSLLHEMTHATGHCSRLNRNLAPSFMTEEYGLEELVAEIGSSLICSQLGIDSSALHENNVAYCQSWLAAVRNDPEMLIKAASMAAKAADMILGRSYEREEPTDEGNKQDDMLLVAA